MSAYINADRTMTLRGTLTLMTGREIALSPSNVVSYTIDERSASEGFALGETQAASYELVIDDAANDLTAIECEGAFVSAEIGIETDGEIEYSPFGVWNVEDVYISKQSSTATLKGSDALGSRFDVAWSDKSGDYPRTLYLIAKAACKLAGVTLADTSWLNSNVSVSKRPSWEDEMTARGIISYVAATAGGFARMNRSGELEIISWHAGEITKATVDADVYTKLETGSGTAFDFNCLGVRYVGKDKFTRYVLDSARADTSANALQIEDNPLMTAGIATTIKSNLDGFTSEAVSLEWIGDPTMLCGDRLAVVDVDGIDTHEFVITQQTLTYAGGLSAKSAATLSKDIAASSGFSSVSGIINSSGMLNGHKISAESITTEKLAAQSITAEKIAAGAITSDKIAAGAITADSIAAGAITADKLDVGALEADSVGAVIARIDEIIAGNLTADELYVALAAVTTLMVQQITAETIDTNELYAALIDALSIRAEEIETDRLAAVVAEITMLLVNNITAESIRTDELAAALGHFVSLYAETGDFDLATIQNLLADAFVLKQGNADTMMITNLAVTNANLLSATLGKLVLRGADGKYYNVFVGADGSITATEYVPTSEELESGETATGQQIAETSANVAALNAQTINGQSAVINSILSETLAAGKITAMDATIASASIPALYATSIKALGDSLDISANTAITARIEREREIEGRVETLESGVRIDENGVTIYQSDSPMQLNLNAEGMAFSENGLTVAEWTGARAHIPRLVVSEACIVGNVALKPGADKHLRFLKYGG